MMYRRFAMAAVCMIATTLASPASAGVVFSENFETYTVGNTLDVGGGANVNGWAFSATPITVGKLAAWPSGVYNVVPNAIMKVDNTASLDNVTSFPNPASLAGVNHSAAASLALPNSGVATLDYDLQWADTTSKSNGPTGLLIRDTTLGKDINIWSSGGSHWITVGDATSVDSWSSRGFGDVGANPKTTGKQHMTVTFDFDSGANGTFAATVSSDTQLYGTATTSATQNLPAGFAPDEIVLWNGAGVHANFVWGSAFDNIVIDSTAIPEPASLALFAMGGLLLVSRRRR